MAISGRTSSSPMSAFLAGAAADDVLVTCILPYLNIKAAHALRAMNRRLRVIVSPASVARQVVLRSVLPPPTAVCDNTTFNLEWREPGRGRVLKRISAPWPQGRASVIREASRSGTVPSSDTDKLAVERSLLAKEPSDSNGRVTIDHTEVPHGFFGAVDEYDEEARLTLDYYSSSNNGRIEPQKSYVWTKTSAALNAVGAPVRVRRIVATLLQAADSLQMAQWTFEWGSYEPQSLQFIGWYVVRNSVFCLQLVVNGVSLELRVRYRHSHMQQPSGGSHRMKVWECYIR